MNDSLHIDRRQFLRQLSLGGLALNEMLALEVRGVAAATRASSAAREE